MSVGGQGGDPGDRPEGDDASTKGFILHGARRVLPLAQLVPDPALVAEGWERRFIADSVRAEEAIELYRQLGYEVRAKRVRQGELAGECADCELLMFLGFRTIYTRKRQGDES